MMIDVMSMKKGHVLWYVNKDSFFPIQVKYESKESENIKMLAFIELADGKKKCVPSNSLFESKIEAEIYSCVLWIKKYEKIENINERNAMVDMVTNAEIKLREYEKKYSDLILYHMMR